jgi:ParB family transcriptional regulator, chromosome partitioning protein
MATAHFRHVRISAIDLRDTTYLLSPAAESPDAALRESIRTHGILFPPLLQEMEPDHFIIVSGRKRILAALEVTEADTLPCLVVPAGSSALSIYALLLEHSLIGGSLSTAQQIAFFAALLRSCSIEEALPLFKKLGHPPNSHQLVRLLTLRNLSAPALNGLHDGILSYNGALKMIMLSARDQSTLMDIITRLRLGGSKQQKLIELCTELIMRKNEDLGTILHPFFSRQEPGQPENIPQQSAALLKWLQNENFPRSSTAERKFSRIVRRLELPPNVHVRHTPAFEDDGVTLCLDFPDPDSMREAWTRIMKIME